MKIMKYKTEQIILTQIKMGIIGMESMRFEDKGRTFIRFEKFKNKDLEKTRMKIFNNTGYKKTMG